MTQHLIIVAGHQQTRRSAIPGGITRRSRSTNKPNVSHSTPYRGGKSGVCKIPRSTLHASAASCVARAKKAKVSSLVGRQPSYGLTNSQPDVAGTLPSLLYMVRRSRAPIPSEMVVLGGEGKKKRKGKEKKEEEARRKKRTGKNTHQGTAGKSIYEQSQDKKGRFVITYLSSASHAAFSAAPPFVFSAHQCQLPNHGKASVCEGLGPPQSA